MPAQGDLKSLQYNINLALNKGDLAKATQLLGTLSSSFNKINASGKGQERIFKEISKSFEKMGKIKTKESKVLEKELKSLNDQAKLLKKHEQFYKKRGSANKSNYKNLERETKEYKKQYDLKKHSFKELVKNNKLLKGAAKYIKDSAFAQTRLRAAQAKYDKLRSVGAPKADIEAAKKEVSERAAAIREKGPKEVIAEQVSESFRRGIDSALSRPADALVELTAQIPYVGAVLALVMNTAMRGYDLLTDLSKGFYGTVINLSDTFKGTEENLSQMKSKISMAALGLADMGINVNQTSDWLEAMGDQGAEFNREWADSLIKSGEKSAEFRDVIGDAAAGAVWLNAELPEFTQNVIRMSKSLKTTAKSIFKDFRDVADLGANQATLGLQDFRETIDDANSDSSRFSFYLTESAVMLNKLSNAGIMTVDELKKFKDINKGMKEVIGQNMAIAVSGNTKVFDSMAKGIREKIMSTAIATARSKLGEGAPEKDVEAEAIKASKATLDSLNAQLDVLKDAPTQEGFVRLTEMLGPKATMAAMGGILTALSPDKTVKSFYDVAKVIEDAQLQLGLKIPSEMMNELVATFQSAYELGGRGEQKFSELSENLDGVVEDLRKTAVDGTKLDKETAKKTTQTLAKEMSRMKMDVNELWLQSTQSVMIKSAGMVYGFMGGDREATAQHQAATSFFNTFTDSIKNEKKRKEIEESGGKTFEAFGKYQAAGGKLSLLDFIEKIQKTKGKEEKVGKLVGGDKAFENIADLQKLSLEYSNTKIDELLSSFSDVKSKKIFEEKDATKRAEYVKGAYEKSVSKYASDFGLSSSKETKTVPTFSGDYLDIKIYN